MQEDEMRTRRSAKKLIAWNITYEDARERDNQEVRLQMLCASQLGGGVIKKTGILPY